MKKKVTEQESEIDRINREAKERFDRDMDEYLESPEFVMCECAKGVSMSVTDLVNLVRPTLPQMDPRYADAVKTYLNWVKNTEHEADTLCRLAKTNPTQARVSLDLWDASLTKDPPECNRLATEIEAAGKNPAWKELDNLRWDRYHSVSVFLREVRLYLDGKPSMDYTTWHQRHFDNGESVRSHAPRTILGVESRHRECRNCGCIPSDLYASGSSYFPMRMTFRFCAAFTFRTFESSSRKRTSSVQWSLFSIPQCVRIVSRATSRPVY